ncbi:glutamate receptor ionotropic, kainate glr-3-like [Procambarus clarkii]|uniref:glutamate receptor ionotropic, kainate glr-3-like n=1 Tax=Procambarus clarkii TaxID=6728 RepID=UPI003743060D
MNVWMLPPGKLSALVPSPVKVFLIPIFTWLSSPPELLVGSYEIVMIQGTSYGTRLPNGTITGTLGLINRSEADLLTALAATLERSYYTDFTDYLFMDDSIVAYKRPVPEADLLGFIKPFTFTLWVLVLSSLVLTSAFTWIVLRGTHFLHIRACKSGVVMEERHALDGITTGEETPDEEVEEEEKDEGVLDTAKKSVWWASSLLLGQPLPWQPRRIYILPALWLLATLILSNVYRSNLMAMLILPRIRLPFDNIEELAASHIPLFVAENNAIHQVIMENDVSTKMGSLKKQMVTMDLITATKANIAGHLAVAATRNVALFYLNYYKTNLGDCVIYVMSERILGASPIVLQMPKGSPFKKKINRAIRSLREMGILDYLMMRSLPYAAFCSKPFKSSEAASSQDSRALELADFYGVFAVYAVGLLLASLAFLIEVISVKMKK